jgi:hypothetical protein
MEIVIMLIAGWVGGGWTGYPSDEPGSPMCKRCGHLLGAAAAVILSLVYFKANLGDVAAGGGIIAMAVLGVLVGSFAVTLVASVMELAGMGRKTGV